MMKETQGILQRTVRRDGGRRVLSYTFCANLTREAASPEKLWELRTRPRVSGVIV